MRRLRLRVRGQRRQRGRVQHDHVVHVPLPRIPQDPHVDQVCAGGHRRCQEGDARLRGPAPVRRQRGGRRHRARR